MQRSVTKRAAKASRYEELKEQSCQQIGREVGWDPTRVDGRYKKVSKGEVVWRKNRESVALAVSENTGCCMLRSRHLTVRESRKMSNVSMTMECQTGKKATRCKMPARKRVKIHELMK